MKTAPRGRNKLLRVKTQSLAKIRIAKRKKVMIDTALGFPLWF
jgi:hypothetical protein